jgi:organic hydroperoxide reductase OsmC/OhrA
LNETSRAVRSGRRLSLITVSSPFQLGGGPSNRLIDGGFGIAVKLRVEDESLKQADLAALTQEAHEKICPYSQT